MRGRPPTPAHLKLITGNPGNRPIDLGVVVPDDMGLPDCPDHLDAVAQAEWARIVPDLAAIGVLTKIDRTALAMYCGAYSLWVEASLELAKARIEGGGGLVKRTPNGFEALNYWLVISNKAQEQLKSYLVEFGMTPVARARVKQMAQGQGQLFGDDPMAAFLRAGSAGANAA